MDGWMECWVRVTVRVAGCIMVECGGFGLGLGPGSRPFNEK
jgi:hypothetical protein